MFNCLCILLLLCLFKNSETSPTLVVGIKGGNVTLPCQYGGSEILDIDLSRSEIIPVCQTEECTCRVCKKGACGVVIKDLSFSDAGKYILRLYYHNNQTELEQIWTYQLCVDDEISVKIGEELKLDVLLLNADKVQHQSRRSTGWREDWSRSDGVQSERMTIRDRNLIISNFTARDAGTYEVLDSEGNILIMLTVTGEISVTIDEELKLSDADKVQHRSIISERKEDWSRNDRVQSEQMTDTDGNLINNDYMDSNSEGETLITMKDSLLLPVKLSIFPVGLALLLVRILVAFKRKKMFRCRNIP